MRAVRCTRADARVLLAPILGRRTDSQGQHDLGDLIERGDPWAIIDGQGRAVGAYLLQDYGAGLLWITAVAGRAAVDMCQVIDTITVHHAADYAELGFRTERPGLVRKACRLGYTVARQDGPAYFLRKKLK